MSTQQVARTLPCPICGKPAIRSPDNRWRPFCSERCKLLDLGQWASEKYRVPVTGPEPDPRPAEE